MNWLFTAIIILIGMICTAVFTGIEIPILKKKQFGQFIREDGPQSHLSKQGTPTMGGLAIYFGIIIASLAGTLIFIRTDRFSRRLH